VCVSRLRGGRRLPDVPATHPHYDAINALVSRSIIGGYGNGSFGPGDPITRQQFAKMVVLTCGLSGLGERHLPLHRRAEERRRHSLPRQLCAVCAARGIAVGKTATTFDP